MKALSILWIGLFLAAEGPNALTPATAQVEGLAGRVVDVSGRPVADVCVVATPVGHPSRTHLYPLIPNRHR